MTNAQAPAEQLTGKVEATNDKGVKVGGEWHNYSKYAKAEAIEIANKGDDVALTLDGAGFVRELAVIKADMTHVGKLPDEDALSNEDAAADAMEAEGMRGLSQKDVLIIRQSCIRGAIDFAASRPEMKAADAIKLAEVLEKWVSR